MTAYHCINLLPVYRSNMVSFYVPQRRLSWAEDTAFCLTSDIVEIRVYTDKTSW